MNPIIPNRTTLVFALCAGLGAGSVQAQAPTPPPVTTGMVVWLPADGVNTSDTNQVRIVGADTFVKQWKDFSTAANKHASNTTEADQPRYITSALNGKPVLRFGQDNDDNGDRLYLGDLSANFPSGASLFVVATIDNDGRYNLFGNRSGNDERWVANSWNESKPGSFRTGRSESSTFTFSDWPQTGSHVFALESSSTEFEVLINGGSIGSDTGSYNSGSGVSWTIGNRATSGQQLRGDIAEVILYNRVLNSAEANAVGYYLGTKYGVSTTYENPNPTVPANLQAIAGDGQVSLTWSAFPGAVSYNVKRSGTAGGPYTTVGSPTGPSFTDSTSLVNGTPYYYVVSAMTGSESPNSSEISATPTGVSASLSTVTSSQPSQRANGVASVTITVTLRNSSSAPIPGKVVTLGATGSPSITTVTGTTGTDGKAVFTATSTNAGTAVFTATDTTSGNLVIAQTAAVDFVDPNTPQLINVKLTDTAETASIISGPAGGLATTWNQLAGPNSSGVLLDSLGSATTAGFTSSGTGGWALSSMATSTPALRLLSHGFRNFGANGTTQQLVITGLNSAKTYDLYIASANLIATNQRNRGEWFTTNTTNTVGNQVVDNRASQNGSTWVRGNNFVLFEDVVPNASGNITVNGFAVLDAPTYDIRLALNGFQLVEDPPSVAGPVSDAMSTVTAAPASVVANGVSASTVKVTLKDANGVRVPNKQVTLANNGGLTPPSALNTDSQGEANFTVSSSTIANVIFTATVVADSLILTDTASVNFTDPGAPVAFNVNFHTGTPATGLVGVVGGSGETWNQGTTSVSNLTDSTGAVASSVNVTGLPDGGDTVNAALNVFDANRCFFGKGVNTTLSITGLVPNTAYDLYIYALSHNSGSWGNFTDTERAAGDFVSSNPVLRSASSQWLDNGLPGVNGNAFVANGNYVVFQSIVSNNLGNISVLADASDGLDNNPATSDGDCRLHINGLQIRPATGMSLDYAAWRSTRYPGLGMPDADDDGDGFSNDYERIFGMNPTSSASSSPYSSGFDSTNGSLNYTRRTQSLINMNYKVCYSTNLVNWFVDNAAIQSQQSVSNDVQIMGVSIDPLLLNQPKLFVRVAATPINGFDPEPTLVNLWGSGNSITLLFSEPMNSSSATNPANYQVLQTGGGNIAITGVTLSSDGGSATLTLASPLGLDTGYTVNLENVTSGTGQSLGTGISRSFKTWDDDPNGIKVFILAGQSNMVGFGNVETGNTGAGTIGSLRYLAVNDATYPDYNYASLLTNPALPATSPFRTRSDVKVWWRDGGASLGGTVKKGDHGPPFKGVSTDRIGPEFAFGHIMGDFYPSHNVLIVKTAWGGKSLAKDYRPPSAVAARGGRVGDYFSAMINYTRDALTNLDTEFPEWAGQGYQIVGMGWHQGFNDLIDATSAAEYKNNLPDLIKDVRTVFAKPNLPFVIATKGQNPAVEASPYTGYGPVEKAQLWVAGVTKPANVLSSDARPFWRDASVSPINEGYHWNHNAETYFLLGKSLGDNMVDLLTP